MTIKAQARPTSDIFNNSTSEVYVKALKDGTLSVAQFMEVMSIEGNVYSCSAGSVTTPITFGAGTIDVTEPDLMVLAADGITIIPLEIILVIEAFGTTALAEYLAWYGSGGAHGTDTDVTIYNVNTAFGNNSACTAGAASNADATNFTSKVVEFWRGCYHVAVTIGTADDDNSIYPAQHCWRAKDAGYYPVIKGSGGFSVACAAQAGTGFIQARFAAFPTTWIE